MGPRQSLSEVVGTHVGSAWKWIVTVFYTQFRSPPPTPINVASTKTHQTWREMGHNIEQGAGGGGGGGFVVCWNSKVLWHLSQHFWNWFNIGLMSGFIYFIFMNLCLVHTNTFLEVTYYRHGHWHKQYRHKHRHKRPGNDNTGHWITSNHTIGNHLWINHYKSHMNMINHHRNAI
jgi:hypothetical protein